LHAFATFNASYRASLRADGSLVPVIEKNLATRRRVVAPSLLDEANHAVLLIDPRRAKLMCVRSHDTKAVGDALALLAKGAKLFGVNALVTTTRAARDGVLEDVREATHREPTIEHTALNPFEDERVVSWVANAGKGKLVMAGLLTESCVAMSALSALSIGYEVYIVTDACGGASRESHEMAVQRVIQTGAIPISAAGYVAELQRDWSRETTGAQVMALYAQHGGESGRQLALDRDGEALGKPSTA
jgi:nicotinamidase-related amidase